MHLYLFRHGQSIENTQAWDGRNENSRLTPLGEAQAQALALWVPENIKLDRLYASPMNRARQTALALGATTGLEVIFDDRLREVGNAYPNGLPFPDDNLPLYYVDRWGSLHPYKPITEEGENWMHFRARIGGFIEWLLDTLPEEHLSLSIGMVCHGGVIEGVFEHVFQKGPWSAVMVHTNNTGITHLEFNPQPTKPAWQLYYHNRTSHLTEDQLS